MSSTSVGADSPYFGTLSVAAVGAADVSTSVIVQARHRIASVGANGSHRRCRDRSWSARMAAVLGLSLSARL
jgi:hypothetical protein